MPLTLEKKIESNPTTDYLTGGFLSGFYGFNLLNESGQNTLFDTNDDVLLRHGITTYECMMLDPKVSKCINTLKTSVIADGLDLVPAVSENNPEYKQALQVKEFCEASIKNLHKPIEDSIEEMLDALIYGHKISEVTYEVKELETFGLKLVPKYIKAKPFGLAKFIVDSNFNIIGITSNRALYKLKESQQENIVVDKSKIISRDGSIYIKTENDELEFVNRDKFIILTIRPRNDDPRGTSFLQAAHAPWYIKQQIYPEYLRYLLVCAIPLLVGFTPEDDSIAADILKDADGNPVIGTDGKYIKFNPVAALSGALVQARNATAIALKGGSKIQEVGNQGNNGIAFSKALEIYDSEIESAILLQTLATSESRYSTRSQADTHMGMLEVLVWGLKNKVVRALTQDLFKPLVKFNYGQEYLKFVPKVSLGDSERRNFASDISSVAELFKVSYFSPEQVKYIDQLLSLPVREDVTNRVGPLPTTQAAVE